MRISHRKKFVFLSRYKCASTTVRRLLDPYSDVASTQCYPYYHHTPLAPLQGHFAEQGWDWDEYFVFTSTRNPWELVLSLYQYALPDAGCRYWWERHGDAVRQDRYDPAQRVPPPDLLPFRDWALQCDFSRFTLEPFIHDAAGRLAVHDFIRVETIQADLDRIGARLGIAFGEIPHANRATGTRIAAAHDRDTVERVGREFAADLRYGSSGYAPPRV